MADDLKELLETWDSIPDYEQMKEIATALLPLLQMLGVGIDTPQNNFNVDVYEPEDNACIVHLFWGDFVVLRLPDKGEMVGLWAMLFPVECEEHGTEMVPFPMASTLPHMLRTGLTNCINKYMAIQLGEVTVPHGSTIN